MKKKWVSGMLALLLVGTTVGSMMPTEAVQAEENSQGKTYYVDSENGKDTNDGLSEGKAFQTLNKVNDLTLGAGDRVLLKNGSVFEDQALHIKGSGSENAPIKISTYGDEKDGRPQINTNGHGQWELNYGHKLDNQNHKWHGTVSSSILLKDVEYIEIEGLEITMTGIPQQMQRKIKIINTMTRNAWTGQALPELQKTKERLTISY